MPLARRALILLLGVSLVFAAAQPGRAQTDLQKAREEAEDAESDLSDARSTVGVRKAQLSETGQALAVAFADFSARTEELETLTFTVLSLEEGIRLTETELAAARDLALDQAVEVYTSAVAGSGLFSLLAGSSPAEAVVAAGILEDLAQGERAEVANYTALRADLDRRREELAEERALLADVRDEVEAEKVRLENLYAGIAEQLAESEARVRAADKAYQAALDAVEQENRRLAMLRGAEAWRSTVEVYFPEWLVDEALAIMHCESRGDPNAVHPVSGASGLMQFLESTWGWASVEAGFDGHSRFDPEANIATAAWLVDVSIQTDHRWGRWGHWACRRVIYPPYPDSSSSGGDTSGVERAILRNEEGTLV